MDSDGNVLSNVAPRRYFCLQCHVPQTDAAPIVENTFTPSKGFGN
jgi:cytochrome c-type protein NapB